MCYGKLNEAILKNYLVVVPCRAGSRGLPNKNFLILKNDPLYLIAAKQGLRITNNVIVSSDKNLEKDLESFPIKFHKRPLSLSSDKTSIEEVLLEIIRTFKLQDFTIILLQPTSPLRQDKNIIDCLKLFKSKKYELVFTVNKQTKTILKSGLIEGNKFIPFIKSDYCFMNRQDLPEVVKPNGAVYVFNGGWFEKNFGFVSNKIGVIKMSSRNSLDIDTKDDFEKVLSLFK